MALIDDPFYNPGRLDPIQVKEVIASQGELRIRFDQPCYGPGLLSELDDLCKEHGDALTVSFYAHDRTGFDASNLRHLPHVRALSIGCHRASNIGTVADLSLTHLKLEVFEMEEKDLLTRLALERLCRLEIGDTRKRDLDLLPLSQCRALRTLTICGQTKGFESISGMPELTVVSLRSIPKTCTLEALGTLPRLESLGMGMGSREDLNEVHSPTLRKLSLGGVLGLSTLGDLSRFPGMEILIVDGQPRLESIDLERVSSDLRVLNLYTCKNLRMIGALDRFLKLQDLAIAHTAIPLEEVHGRPLPPSLRSVRLVSGKAKPDRELRTKLDSMGYREFPEVMEY